MSCVLLIDDHAMFREGLTLALAQADPTLQIHSVASGTEALALLHSEPAITTIIWPSVRSRCNCSMSAAGKPSRPPPSR